MQTSDSKEKGVLKKFFLRLFYTVYALETKKMGKLQQYSEENEHLALGPRM